MGNCQTVRMPAPAEEVLPFALPGGWPAPLRGCAVTFRESGILLGSLWLEDDEWRALRATPALALRIDDHPAADGSMTTHPNGSQTRVDFDIPMVPAVVPLGALANGRAFADWVQNTHGALGRLLIWEESCSWWMLQDADLELVVTCAPPGMLSEESEELSWLSLGTATRSQEVEELGVRYQVTWAE
jgi:hypothetical protein